MAAVTTRRVCAAAALLLLATACSSHRDLNAVGGTLDTSGAATSTTQAGGAATTAHGATATTARPRPNAGDHNVTTADTAVADAALGAPGEFAGVLLGPSAATHIVLDVLVQSGVSADPNAIATLRQILAASSAKPVTVRGPSPLNAAGNVSSADDVRRLADQQGSPQTATTAVVHVLYLKGSFTDNSVLGVTVRADTTAIFPDQIANSSSPLVSQSRLEQAVTTHELGHVMGLVDLYLDDNRDDAQHPGHSTNPHSVMYWAVETDLVAQVLDGPPPVSFDAADQADLTKIHSGAAKAH